MKTVYVIGAGASIGGSSTGVLSGFPAANGILYAIRKMIDKERIQHPQALCTYLSRFSPYDYYATIVSELREEWDSLNIEELYSALEFESRISDDLVQSSGLGLDSGPFYNFYFTESYRNRVQNLLEGDYRNHFEERYNAFGISHAFPHLHRHFISIVKMELLDMISVLFANISANGEFNNFDELSRRLNDGDDIVSYNYDLLMEEALKRQRPDDWCFHNGYALKPIGPHPTNKPQQFLFHGEGRSTERSKYKIYKPHGSCNWHILTSMAKSAEIVPEPVGCTQIRRQQFDGIVVTSGYQLGGEFQNVPNQHCERLMIPPTPYKADYCFNGDYLHGPGEMVLMHISFTGWQPQLMFHNSFHSLRNANRIVFIGFSMAPVDVPTRLMFLASAQANKNLQSVTIANPDREARKRIEQIYPNVKEIHRYDFFADLLKAGV